MLFVLLGMMINFYLIYENNRSLLHTHIDKTLKESAHNANLLFNETFHDRALHREDISKEEDQKNIAKLSLFTNNLDITYIYTMIEREGKIYFTSSSALKNEIESKEETHYFDEYDEATPLLKNVLQEQKIVYEESTDKWGTFRTIFIPMKSKKGTPYIIGADIKIDFIQTQLEKILIESLRIQLILFLILVGLAWYFMRLSKTEIVQIRFLKEELDSEIANKTQELEALNQSLEERVQEEIAKNREKDTQLLQQARLAQMGEMISMIAHQWRQPLSAISATSDSLFLKSQLGQLDLEGVSVQASNISTYAQHLSTTIDDFRNFFKPNKEKESCSYTKMLHEVLHMIETPILTKNIVIEKVFHSEKVFYAYPNELKQVILNLIKNAEDVLLEKKIQDAKISIYTEGNILRIEDNGGGIPEEMMEKIFDPYFSTKLHNGTGLGLYMSKIIIEEHCLGSLRVFNTQQGACFEIELLEP